MALGCLDTFTEYIMRAPVQALSPKPAFDTGMEPAVSNVGKARAAPVGEAMRTLLECPGHDLAEQLSRGAHGVMEPPVLRCGGSAGRQDKAATAPSHYLAYHLPRFT